VTRRCLNDGHYYCSGESQSQTQKLTRGKKKKKKPKACSSEFDYAAWKQWGEWRRKVLRTLYNDRVFKGCEDCDFPSMCRYPLDTHPLGDVGTAVATETSPTVSEKVEKAREKNPEMTLEQEMTNPRKSTANAGVDFDQILQSILEDADTTMLDADSLKACQADKSDQKTKKRKGKSGESEMIAQDLRLCDVYGLWADLEDVELEKRKTDQS
jgi:hypothetical protein